MIKQKVLVFDIETSPLIAYAWGRRDVNIAVNQVVHDWYVLAFAAKWLGEPASAVIYRDQRASKPLSDDRKLLRTLWVLLDAADIVITQNGKNFDSKMINARFIMHGMRPPSPYRHIDTYQIARSTAKFTSNSLEYLTDKLCTKYKKLKHEKFPGMALWDGCLKGNKAAWDEMKKYNVHDVLATEELYMKLRAWAPVSAPAVFPDRACCETCGAKNSVAKNGFKVTRNGAHQRYCCLACGRHSGDRKKLRAVTK